MKTTVQNLHNYDNFNFWQLDLNEFPSRGRLYPKNTKIKARSMSVLEVKFLATLSPQNATLICNELLEKCTILENIKYEDLLLADREFIIFWIRLNSFITRTWRRFSCCVRRGKSYTVGSSARSPRP